MVDSSTEKQTEPAQGEASSKAVRQGLARMGTWGWGGKGDSVEKADGQDDDSRIRFTIGGAGQRLTKEDFLRQIQSLDPKERAKVMEGSDASPAMKAAVKRESESGAPRGIPGTRSKASGRPQQRADMGETSDEDDSNARPSQTPLPLSRRKDAPIASSSTGGRIGRVASYDDDEPETAAERKRREKAMKGVEDERPASSSSSSSPSGGRGRRSRSRSVDKEHAGGYYTETPAERRRREAALGHSTGGDGTRDEEEQEAQAIKFEEPTVPRPVVQPLRGIRFADEQVKKK